MSPEPARSERPVGTENLGTLLRNPVIELNRRITEELRRAGFEGVRPAHGPVFQFIDDRGTRITELAARAELTKATIVYLVNDLEAMGYVERLPDESDGRAKLVRPTKRGRELVANARRALGEITAEWAELVGEAELEQLRRLLVRLNRELWPEN